MYTHTNTCWAARVSNMDRNINVFGLAFIITFTAVLMILDLGLLRFLTYNKRFRRTLAPRIEHWVQDGVFQLQRRAYEANNQGSWDRLEKEIPIERTGDQLRHLPLRSK